MDKENFLKRLYFRSAHRGSKETDLILGPYAKEHLSSMDDKELKEFEAFLEENDNDIWDWIAGKYMPEDGKYKDLIAELQKRHAIPD